MQNITDSFSNILSPVNNAGWTQLETVSLLHTMLLKNYSLIYVCFTDKPKSVTVEHFRKVWIAVSTKNRTWVN